MAINSESDSQPVIAAPQRVHLSFLDGIRGLAALYVVGFHIMDPLLSRNMASSRLWYVRLSHIFSHGHSAVDVFIVLSGFCLMIPVARAGGEFRDGVAAFFRRRSRRILPPYYASLVLTAIVVALKAFIDGHSLHGEAAYSAHFYIGYAVTHILLIQNVFPLYSQTLNGALWTIATEWQIYFVFAFILLPLFKKWGPIAPIAFGILVGFATCPFDFRNAAFWYIGLFAVGMTGADMCFSAKPRVKMSQQSLLWTSIICAVLSTCSRYFVTKNPGDDPLTDLFTGTCCAALIAYLVRSSPSNPDNAKIGLKEILSSRACVNLGAFSYSLYLIHMPIIYLALSCLGKTSLSGDHKFLLMYLAVMPFCLVLAYGFHLLFEKPFMVPAPKPIDRSPTSPDQIKETQPSRA